MAEARRPSDSSAASRNGSASGGSNNEMTRKKPKASPVELTVAFEGLAVTPPPSEPRVGPESRIRGLQQHPGRASPSYSPRSHRKGQLTAKKLFQQQAKKVQSPEWTDEEHKQLLEFMLLYTDGKTWVMHKEMRFWEAAGKFIQQRLQTVNRRSGT